jgi:SOS response regulatory protein OraA/RecX
VSDSNNELGQSQVGQASSGKAAKGTRPWFKKKRFVIPIALLLIVGFSNAANQGSSEDSTLPAPVSDSSQQETTEAQAESEATGGYSNETSGQKNARESAESYLSYSAFSKSGLFDQLIFEEYSEQDSEYAVNTVKVDWNEQAAKSAKSYLDYSSFSRQGLIDQLVYEGFSQAEAEYGVDAAGLSGENSGSQESSGESVSQKNAIGSAESYLKFSAFSREGLIDQLIYEDYSKADAEYAVDALDPDWNEQAAKSAKSYLDYSSFSRQGLIDQLIYEGFSKAEAEYGVKQNGY